MNQGIYAALMQGAITMDEGLNRSPEPAELQSMIEHGSRGGGGRKR